VNDAADTVPPAEGSGAQWQAERAAILAHPGRRAVARWRGLRTSLYVLQANEQQLLDVIESVHEDSPLSMSMLGSTDPERLEAFWDELQRLIHNYVAASFSLIRHATVLADRYGGTQFRADYASHVTAIDQAPVSQFFKGFRNLVQHGGLPAVGMTSNLAATSYGGSNVIWLASQDLLRSKGTWSATAKQYLQDHDPLILWDAVSDYSKLVTGLYDWVFVQFEALHGADVADHDRLLLAHEAAWRDKSPT
jgi:hypothetical protein